jgi:hypothetical protein
MIKQKLLAPYAVTLVVLAAGCGSGASTSSNSESPVRPAEFRTPRDLLINRHDIASQTSAPAAAILRWWQALQFQDVVAASRAYSVKVPRKRLQDEIRGLSSFLTSARPQIEETDATGRSARVLSTIQWVAFKPSGTTVVELPVSFYLVERGGKWKLASDAFLANRLQAQQPAKPPR